MGRIMGKGGAGLHAPAAGGRSEASCILVRMFAAQQSDRPRTPKWIWAVAAAFVLVPMLGNAWVANCPPEGMAWTGLRTIDSYAYLSAMLHYRENRFSPYARVGTLDDGHGADLYALPHHRLYGYLGMAGHALHIPPFLFLGIANGLGVAFLLLAAYGLLRESVPRLSGLAFLIFALGGGVGGVLCVLTGVLGCHRSPSFPDYFLRYFVYDLNEGARFQPYLLMDRLYYTLPLGLGFLALAGAHRALRGASWRAWAGTCAAIFLAAFLNLRLGPMLLAVGMLMILTVPGIPRGRRCGLGAAFALAGVLGGGWAFSMLSGNGALSESVFRSLSGVMWLLPFASATLLYWLVVPWAITRGLDRLPRWARVCGYAALGYALTYIILYLLYQAYYGNWLHGGDTSAAIAVSDPALVGAVGGALYGLRHRPSRHVRAYDAPGWFALWFLLFFAVSVSALGHGWFIQFMPQRGMVMLGLPLAVLCAAGLMRLQTRHPKQMYWLTAGIVVCGVSSLLITWGIVYAPQGARTAQRAFPWTRCAFMHAADARLIERLRPGVALTPSLGDPLFGDVLALRPGMRVVYGNGTMDYSREVMPEVRARVARFFTAETPETFRQALIADWRVDFVFCPDTAPVPEAVLDELRRTPWLREIAAEGRGAVFEVTR